ATCAHEQGSLRHDSPGFVQMPQLALQQTGPTLHVLGPHGVLMGTWTPSQRCCEQVPPGGVQMPQLALQQTSPTLHVFCPQGALKGEMGPQSVWLHDAPGGLHWPQLALQHTWPSGHVTLPQRTPRAASSVLPGAADASCAVAAAARDAS